MANESNSSPFDDVKLFMSCCGDITDFEGLLGEIIEHQPPLPPAEVMKQVDRYITLIHEEVEELQDARTREQALDAIMDILFVTIGLGVTLGFPLKDAWEEVCRSNMTKIDKKTGQVIRREDGKILKPEGYSPPDLKKVLNANYSEKKHLQAV